LDYTEYLRERTYVPVGGGNSGNDGNFLNIY